VGVRTHFSCQNVQIRNWLWEDNERKMFFVFFNCVILPALIVLNTSVSISFLMMKTNKTTMNPLMIYSKLFNPGLYLNEIEK